MSSIIDLLTIALILVLMTLAVFVLFYRRANKDISFVRTGLGGEKVILNNGALVFPFFHNYIKINMKTIQIPIQLINENHLTTSDHIHVDIIVHYFVRVDTTMSSVALAAQTMGEKTFDTMTFIDSLEERCEAPVNQVVNQMTLKELQHKKDYFCDEVHKLIGEDLASNGLVLQSLALTNTRRTERKFYETIEEGRQRIERSISFDAEFKQSGISILSYFSEIISKKYPNIDVAVKIEQRGNTVILDIETPEGEIEKIERELTDYGLVIVGKKSPEEYLDNPTDALVLRHKIEMAELEARQTNNLLNSERNQFNSRIRSMEEQILFLQNIFDKQQYESYKTVNSLRAIANNSSKETLNTIDKLVNLIENGLVESDKNIVIHHLREIREQSPSVFEKIHETILKGAVQGTAGNYLYSWIQALGTLA